MTFALYSHAKSSQASTSGSVAELIDSLIEWTTAQLLATVLVSSIFSHWVWQTSEMEKFDKYSLPIKPTEVSWGSKTLPVNSKMTVYSSATYD